MKRFAVVLIYLWSGFTVAEDRAPPRIITERQGNVTVHRAEGSLAATQEVGCIPLSGANNAMTPPDLYQGMVRCIDQGDYDRAAGLFALAGMYARYDAKRVTDKSARLAKTVLLMSTFSSVAQDRREAFGAALERVKASPQLLEELCSGIRKVGKPGYYPAYMILHGIRAFTGNPHEGALLQDFDGEGTWKALQESFLHCPP